jgi:hypothetical protein
MNSRATAHLSSATDVQTFAWPAIVRLLAGDAVPVPTDWPADQTHTFDHENEVVAPSTLTARLLLEAYISEL